MTTYLQINDGPFGLLVAIDRVVEVGDIGGASTASGLRAWRDGNLRVFSLGTLLGRAVPSARQQVVLRRGANDDGDVFALDVERVTDLLDIDDGLLQPVVDMSAAQSALVDAAWPMADGNCLLRLRAPFTWAHDGPDTHHGATTP